MERAVLLEHLTQAEQRIGNGECRAARLRQDLERLERSGQSTADTRQALQVCAQSQAEQWAERARLSAELSKSVAAPC
jgi:hypothetical protein